MGHRNYIYYQPNQMDLKDRYGDCTIRALSKVMETDWLATFDFTIPYCRKHQVPNIWFCPANKRKEIFSEMGYEYHGISNKKGTKRPVVWKFAKDHPNGRYLVNVANHVVAVVDGKYYDTWDSGDKPMYGWFEPVENGNN